MCIYLMERARLLPMETFWFVKIRALSLSVYIYRERGRLFAWTEVMEPFWFVVMRSWRPPKSVASVG